MRILHLGKYYAPAVGGIETHLRTLAAAQAELGHEVEIACLQHEDKPTSIETHGPIRLTRLRRAVSYGNLDYCPDLAPLLRSTRADLIHLQVPNPTMILALLAIRPPCPIVVTYQSDHVHQHVRAALFRPLEHVFYPQVARIIATSPTYIGGSSLLRAYRHKVTVLPMGINLAQFLQPSEEDRKKAEAIRARHPGPIWVACGRLVPYKGHTHAIEALRHVPGTLLLCGDGPERDRLWQQVVSMQLIDRVKFIGEDPHPLPYYLAATALWFPSIYRSEAFGLAQVEAMAAGCPVINTAVPNSGVAWVSRDGESGLTVPLGDSRALAAAASRLVAEPDLRDRLARGARARAVSEFSLEVMTSRCLALYREVLGVKETVAGYTAVDLGHRP